ncbi:MAG: RNA polymerase sigma-70 factor [Bacteroidota bacterium]
MEDIKLHSDIDLIALIKDHDARGLDELFRRYAHSLFDFGIKFLMDAEIAKELVSDVFLQIWLKRDELRIKSNVKAYLFTSLKNRCLNYLSRNKKFFETFDGQHESTHPHTEDADLSIRKDEASSLADKILKDLPQKRELVFRMHRLQGFSYKEIAEILGISENTVHNHMVAAIKQLAKSYPKWKNLLISLAIHMIALSSF